MKYLKDAVATIGEAKWVFLFVLLSRFAIPESYWLASMVTVLLVTFMFKQRDLILQISPFLFVASLSAKGYYIHSLSISYEVSILAGFIISVIAFLLYCLSLHLFERYIKNYQLMILILFLAAGLTLSQFVSGSPEKHFLMSYLFFVQSGFWYFILSFGEKNILSSGVFFTRLNLSHFVSRIPIPPQLLIEHRAGNRQEFLEAQKSGIYALSIALALRFTYKGLISYFSLSEEMIGEIFHLAYLNVHIHGVYQSLLNYYSAFGAAGPWLSIYTMAFLIIINTIAFSGFAVAYYQCLGFRIPHFIKPILTEKYFHEFLSSLYRYYNKALVSIFFVRFHRLLSFSKRKYRIPISAFLTIFIGGWMFSLQKDILTSKQNFFEVFVNSLPGLVYFFVLAALVAISVWIQKRRHKSDTAVSSWRSLAYLGLFFLIFGFILSFRLLMNFGGMSLDEAMKTIRSLFY